MPGNRCLYLEERRSATFIEIWLNPGPSVHSGECVVRAGRATVQAVMEDMGIDLKKVIG